MLDSGIIALQLAEWIVAIRSIRPAARPRDLGGVTKRRAANQRVPPLANRLVSPLLANRHAAKPHVAIRANVRDVVCSNG